MSIIIVYNKKKIMLTYEIHFLYMLDLFLGFMNNYAKNT